MLLKLVESIQKALDEDSVNPQVEWEGHNSLTEELVSVALDFPEAPKDFSIELTSKKKYKKVILVSGGMDSCIMWWLTKDEPDRLALFIHYDQPYARKELQALKNFGINPKKVACTLKAPEGWKHIIPARNLALIAIAEQYVAAEGEIWIGVVSGESRTDAGDKSKLFMDLVHNFIWRTKQKFVTIKTLEDKTKNEWLRLYLEDTGNQKIIDTVTCFSNEEGHCGKCQACVRKWIALKYNKIETTIFTRDPFIHGYSYIQKYIDTFQSCLSSGDFSHYSEERCTQDLRTILRYIDEEKESNR